MLRKMSGLCTLIALAASLVHAADTQKPPAGLSAEQIVERNVTARGGLQAWRAVKTLSLQGKIGAGGNQRATLVFPMSDPKEYENELPRRPTDEAQLPFLLEMERPRKSRLELKFNGQTAVQVYDGANGWKVRPFLNRPEVEPFSEEELKKASGQEDLDGPLVDYVAKGSKIELDGTEKVEGHDTYRLKVTENSGHTFHVWIDAETFLEAKIEGQPRRLDGTDHPVEIYYRDYRTIGSLRIPFIMETRVLPVARNALNLKDTPVPPERIVIDKVVVNPKLDDNLFTRPQLSIASKNK